MGTDASKVIVRNYLETWIGAMVTGDYDALESVLADDSTLCIAGLFYDGKEAIVKRTEFTGTNYDMTAGVYQVLRVVAEGDMVVVELRSEMLSREGRRVCNYPVHVIDVNGGKMQAHREYVDRRAIEDARLGRGSSVGPTGVAEGARGARGTTIVWGFEEATINVDASPTEIKENRETALSFIEAHAQGDWQLVESALADDATWQMGESTVYRGREQISAVSRQEASLLDMTSVSSEIRHIAGEGNMVVVETTLRATSVKGKPYENLYANILEMKNGKVQAWREYFDRGLAKKVLED